MKKTILSRNLTWFLISLLSVSALFVYLYQKGPFMMTNDNFYLKSVISGEMTGTPDQKAFFLGVLFCSLTAFFYRILPTFPWYGMIMTASLILSFSYVIYRLILACRSAVLRMIFLFISLFITYGFFAQHIVQSEFTTITGIVACTAVFAFYLTKEDVSYGHYLRSLIPVFLFSLWALSMRDDAFYMILPFFGMILLGKGIDQIRTGSYKRLMPLFVFIILFLTEITVLRSVDRLTYSSDDWSRFESYSSARSRLYDYYGFPEYDSHRSFYEDLGITQSSYVAMTTHYNILLDPSINRDSMEKLAALAKSEADLERSPVALRIIDVFQQFIERNFLTYTERPLNVLVYLLYAVVLFLILIGKKATAFRDYLFLIISRSFDWIYLILGGRYPFRVTQIIFTADLFLLIGLILKYRLWTIGQRTWRKHVLYPAAVVTVFLCCAACIRFGLPVAKGNISMVNSWYRFSACYRELEDYLYDHPDNFYYFDMTSLYFMEEVLAPPRTVTDPDTGKEKILQHNYLYMGSWMPNSPWYDAVLRQQDISDIGQALISKSNVYLIYQPVADEEPIFLQDYYDDHYPGTILQKIDELQTSTGMRYEFWKAYTE